MTNNNNKRSLPSDVWCECSTCSKRVGGGLLVSAASWRRHNKNASLKNDDIKRLRRTNDENMDVVGKYSRFRLKQ